MDTIENQLAAALTLVAEGSAAVTEAREHASKLAADNMELTDKVAKLVIELETAAIEKDALLSKIASLEALTVSASEEAAKIAASVGVAPVESSPADAPVAKTEDDIRAEFLSMPHGINRTRFYQAHRAILNPANRR